MSIRIQRVILSTMVLVCCLALPACTPAGPTQTAGGKPAVTIAAPAPGAQFSPGQTVNVQIIATDAQGIARMELWIDNALVATQNPPPPALTYQGTLVWVTSTPGAHALLVRAINAAGAVSDPAQIGVLVLGPGGPATTVAQPPATPGAPTASPPAPTPATTPAQPTPTAPTAPPTVMPTPAPTSAAAGTVYDLIAQANQPDPWLNSPGMVKLRFGEEYCGDAGCAFWRTAPNTLMEDGSRPARVLVARPQRAPDGGIMQYQEALVAIQAGDRLVGKVGLLAGPTATDEIRFMVAIKDMSKPSGHKITVDLYDTADGQLKSFDVPLAEWAGRPVQFLWQVWSKGSPIGDRAVWVELRVVRQ